MNSGIHFIEIHQFNTFKGSLSNSVRTYLSFKVSAKESVTSLTACTASFLSCSDLKYAVRLRINMAW